MFSTKKDVRAYLLEVKHFINLSAVCRHLKLPKQSLNSFLKGYDGAVSLDRLNDFCSFIINL